MFRIVGLLAVIFLTSAQTAPQPAFAVGQVWSIRAAEPTSMRVVVGRIDPVGGRVAVSVSILDAPLPAGVASGQAINIAHAPFDQNALAGSVDRLLATGASPAPQFEEGYQSWQSARGGIFTISVADAVQAMFSTVYGAAKAPALATHSVTP